MILLKKNWVLFVRVTNMQKINTSNMDVYELDTTKPYLIIVKEKKN
jgi:hypothetical protein